MDRYKGKMNEYDIDDLSPSIVRNNNKCILCRRCVAACINTQAVGVIGPVGRGFKTQIKSAWDQSLNEVACINCGQCIAACPTGALYEKDGTKEVWNLLADDEVITVVQPAPAVRAALGEEVEPYMDWNGQKWHIDLKAVNALWLRRSGVGQIDVCGHCTACRPDLYWSHRKMGQARGSQIAMICL